MTTKRGFLSMTYDELLSRAIARASERGSIRQAAPKIGITPVSLGEFVRWRETNKFPSDEVLFRIASLAGEDKVKSHFATMAVRAKDPEISKAYESLLA
ncbi:hypothetical protein EXU30_00020 [Shewanella maritima]|uniref:XRE family transcriptional regulator n=1 Tax=Shewanella maritima TaxID=2520507 RepID=A0A411PCH1_9GAMM|nr:hypothetical protein [Shewanella maritima]QBF81255.1 hypothetical protein EXU30_00020 [Shewanella maritima]